jgi:hypothetical protein
MHAKGGVDGDVGSSLLRRRGCGRGLSKVDRSGKKGRQRSRIVSRMALVRINGDENRIRMQVGAGGGLRKTLSSVGQFGNSEKRKEERPYTVRRIRQETPPLVSVAPS